MIDPARQLLDELENPQLYRRFDEVPLFSELDVERTLKDGKKTRIIVTEKDLKDIILHQRQLEQLAFVVPRVTAGHTIEDRAVPEFKQPAPWGWTRNWKIGKFNGRATILGSIYLSRQEIPLGVASDGQKIVVIPEKEAKTYPYRSAEYLRSRNEITGIALLRRDPELDLGIVTFAEDNQGEEFLYFVMESAMADTPSTPSSPSTPSTPSGMDPTQHPDASAPSPEDSHKFMMCMKHNMPHLMALHDHMAKGGHLMHFGMAMPSPTNAAPPSPVGHHPSPESTGIAGEGMGMMSKQEDVLRMQAEQQAIRLQKLEAELAAERQARVDANLLAFQRENEQIVTQLEAEGCMIRDRAKEVAKMTKMTRTERDDRAEEIRTSFQRDITRLPDIRLADIAPDGKHRQPGRASTESEVQRVNDLIVKFSREKGQYLTFAQAEEMIFGVGKTG